MMRRVLHTWNPRQLLCSTVITNNGKNNQKFLASLSRVAHRHFSVTPASAEAVTDEALDWMKNLYGTDNEKLTGRRGDWWWTGPNPNNGFDHISNHTSHVSCLPQLTLNNTTERSVRNHFENSWLMTEILFSGLQGEEAFYRPPYHHLRHPMVFYLGHPSTFYVNKLRVAGLIPNGIDPYFEEIFEVGVDEMRWDDISMLSKDWPTVSEVHDYRRKTFEIVSTVISEQYGKQPVRTITKDGALWSLVMGVEHEKIHLETSSVLMRELPMQLLRKPEFFPELHHSYQQQATGALVKPSAGKDYPTNEFVSVSGEVVTLGKPVDTEDRVYGWDNEYGARQIAVNDFHCSKLKVSNGEFYEFVQQGGYREKQFWTEDGWKWRVYRNAKWPTFWVQRGPAGSHDYALRTIFEEVNMPWSWPVNVNYHEAAAFCNWKQSQLASSSSLPTANTNLRLVTEAEHHCLRDEAVKSPLVGDAVLNDPAVSKGACDESNNHLMYGSESPVDNFAANSKGVHDLFGNVWEWTEDDFNPFDGFKVHPYYDDFSSPCFDGCHNMILGGSFISCSDNGGNVFSRYHFRPHFHQHAGFRYVLPSEPEPQIKGQNTATFLGEQKAKFSAANLLTSPPKESAAGNTSFVVHEDVSNTYETDRLLDQYLALHFGQQAENVNQTLRKHANRPDHAIGFAERSAQMLAGYFGQANSKDLKDCRVLDIGCAVGAASFALAEDFGEVVGFDFSASFINKANEIKGLPDQARLKFQVPVQGNIFRSNIEASLPSLSVRQKASFLVGDATKLADMKLGTFDAVLCANLMCRLPEPTALLTDLEGAVNKNGIVLFLSPYSWLEEFTPREKWLQEGDKMSFECLREEMEKRGFKLVGEEDVPLMIREHERKYQYIISHATAFQKL